MSYQPKTNNMKRTKNLLIATTAIVAIAATLFVGCKKDKDETENQPDKTEVLANRIKAFQKLRDAINSGAKTEGTMTVDEMREMLCLVSNYEHSEHETYCLNTTLDTLHVAMPTVDMDGYVSETDVVEVYNAYETELLDRMGSVGDNMDVPSLFSIVLPSGEAKENDDIEIIFTRGQEAVYEPLSSLINGPFDGICLYWGWELGSCNNSIGIPGTDAAVELSRCFKFDYSAYNGTFYFWDVEYVDYVGTDSILSGHANWNYWESGFVTDCDQWLFYYLGNLSGGPEPCLCEDELNCEYVNIKNDFSLSSGSKYYSPTYGSPFFECRIAGIYDKNPREFRAHLLHVTYANYHYAPYQY